MWLLLLVILQGLFISPHQSAKQLPTEGNVPVTVVSTVVGMLTHLPCNISPGVPGDRVLLVLWYKDGYTKPIHSFDLRNVQDNVDTIMDSMLGDRVTLNIKTQPALLTFMGVQEDDMGTYRCRVDFKKSPTRFKDVQLSITVPPKDIVFLDEKGSEIQGRIGPYLEGTTLVLTCDVIGGWPSSSAVWWRDDRIIDSSWEKISPGKSRNTLKIEHLRRTDHGANLECRGNNNNQTKYVQSHLTIHLQMGPESVTVVGPESAMAVETEYRWECVSYGANPPPTLTWWNHRDRELPSVQQNSEDGNKSVSTLKFIPRLEDEGRSLVCRADHPALKSSIEARQRIQIKYKPQLWLQLGTKLEEQTIKEGEDVYFSCSVKATPPIHKVVWKHNGEVISGNVDSGFTITEDNLIIRRITSAFEGKYSCEGTNSEGTGSSNEIYLTIAFVPRCRGESEYRRVSKGESVRFSCPVHAIPPPFKYRWEFNSSTFIRPLQSDSSGGASFTPLSDSDYGSVLCWGINRLGQQLQPCSFHLYPTGKPEAVSNCSLHNTTSTSVHVSCLPGQDNGATQQFALEMLPNEDTEFENINGAKLINKDSPNFLVKSLAAGTGFTFRVFGFNENGAGPGVEIKVFTLSVENQKHVSEVREGPIPVKMTSLVWVFLGIMSVLVLVLVIAGAVARISTVCSRKPEAEKDTRIINPSEKYLIYEDKNQLSPINLHNNPDIIPDRERNRGVEMKRRNSYASETFNSPTQLRNNVLEEQPPMMSTMYCTLPKNRTSRLLQINHPSSQIGRSQLPTLFEQNSTIPRAESSAEDLTLEGRVNRDEPAPAPPEFADSPPTPSSPFLQMMRGEEGEELSINTTRF